MKRLKPYLYIAPALLVIALIFFYPVVEVLRTSFLRIASGRTTFVGLGNYRSLFQDEVFVAAIRHNGLLLIAVPVMLFLALVLGVLLFEGVRGWRFYRSVLFMPYVIAIPVVGIVFSYIFQLNGILNTLLRAVGLNILAADWLGSPRFALWTIMGVVVWKEFGFGVVLFLARLLGVLLFEGVRGWRFYRSVLFMPYVIAIPVVGIVFSYIFQLNGILNTLLRAVGLNILAADWLGSPRFALWTIMGVVVWKEFGFGVVLFLARLMSVEEELFEAARIEGAGWLQVLFRITIPQLATVIEFFVVIMIITMLSWVFNYVYVMSSGGPGNSTMVAELYIYLMGFRYNLQGPAAAASIVLLAITVALILARLNISRRIELE
ncbi:MAG: hypothetical protein A2V99_13995 [Spirochaetes bacterium RBG_16_67_19]|nr:MAG: hypothetical protein A2V99_13995 [Spirochaetes bacterium RBG_16_67_19]